MKIVSEIKNTGAIEFAQNMLLDLKSANKINKEIRIQYDNSIAEQGYNREVKDDIIYLKVSDEAGAMYGLLDLVQYGKCHDSLEQLGEKKTTPYIKCRGIKFNIPLDARTPSYSDASDSASNNIENMWDFDFWRDFIDRMAMNKYNVLSLWSLSPFPSMVRIPEYPLTALDDVKKPTRPYWAELSGWGIYSSEMAKSLITVKKLTMDEKISFWQSVMEYAKSRCVDIYLFTWNVFTYGTEGTPYGITASQDNPVTEDYLYCAVKAMMKTYPLLAGIGVTSGEHMHQDDTDVPFMARTFGRAVREVIGENPDRDFRFIHRMQMANYDQIINEFKNFPCPFEISFKYSNAHMYSNVKPRFIDEFMEVKDEDIKLWLTVRNDDFYMFRWGEPAYAREYLKNMPVDTMTGFYMGADGYTWGRDYMDVRDESHRQFVDKMWYMIKIWGETSYDMSLDDVYFKEVLREYFELESGSQVYEAWNEASAIIPKVNCVHWQHFDFQWYPEACCYYDNEVNKLLFSDINEFVGCGSAPGDCYYSIWEYCNDYFKGDLKELVSPIDMANQIKAHADKALIMVKEIRDSGGESAELSGTLDDMEALSVLGYYYETKIRAAVDLQMYRLSGQKAQQDKAVSYLNKALGHWKDYAAKTKLMYKSQVLTRFNGRVDVEAFINQAEMDILLAQEG